MEESRRITNRASSGVAISVTKILTSIVIHFGCIFRKQRRLLKVKYAGREKSGDESEKKWNERIG
jgi:hypothetical protein